MTTEELNENIDHVLPQIKLASDTGTLFDVVIQLRRQKNLSIQHGNVVRDKLVEEGLAVRGTSNPKTVRILPKGTDVVDKYGGWLNYLLHQDEIAEQEEHRRMMVANADAQRLAQEDDRAERHLTLTERSVKATRNSAIAAWGSAVGTLLSVIVSVYTCRENKAESLKNNSIDTLSSKILRLEMDIELLKASKKNSADTSTASQPAKTKAFKR